MRRLKGTSRKGKEFLYILDNGPELIEYDHLNAFLILVIAIRYASLKLMPRFETPFRNAFAVNSVESHVYVHVI